jgi:YfiH family protein
MPVEPEAAALPLLRPHWPAPPGVGAAMSLRQGGCSRGPYASLNLGVAVGDDAAAVAENRARFARALGARPRWLRQVHGVQVLRMTQGEAPSDEDGQSADAAWTSDTGLACTVQVADCLPVLLASRDGRVVAAAHAGWRGLALGVLEASVQALRTGAGVQPFELQAWLGPCIGPRSFEVGEDVLAAFGLAIAEAGAVPALPGAVQACFQRRDTPGPDGCPRWLADLPALARLRLLRLGLPPQAVFSAGLCTVEQSSDFFSFRREQARGLPTGRLAAAIWRQR